MRWVEKPEDASSLGFASCIAASRKRHLSLQAGGKACPHVDGLPILSVFAVGGNKRALPIRSSARSV